MGSITAVLLFSLLVSSTDDRPGYRDTPVIPGQKWRVHDADRPRPKVVDPGDHVPCLDLQRPRCCSEPMVNWGPGPGEAVTSAGPGSAMPCR